MNHGMIYEPWHDLLTMACREQRPIDTPEAHTQCKKHFSMPHTIDNVPQTHLVRLREYTVYYHSACSRAQGEGTRVVCDHATWYATTPRAADERTTREHTTREHTTRDRTAREWTTCEQTTAAQWYGEGRDVRRLRIGRDPAVPRVS
jgi:hypothetical protein